MGAKVLLAALGGPPGALSGARAVLAGAAAAILLVVASSQDAFAVVKFPSLGRITGPAPAGAFKRLGAEASAVNGFNGHIYIADSGNGRVYNFASPSDTSPEVWDGSSTHAGSFGEGVLSVAVDNETGDVYVADLTHLVIDKFDVSGNLITAFGDSKPTDGQLAGLQTPAGSFAHAASPIGIAVDQATHDLYVIDSGHEVIDVFTQEGEFLPAKQITATPLGLYGCGGLFTDGIAVNAKSGHVLISDGCSEEVFEFDASGIPMEPWSGIGAPNLFAGSLALAVDDTSGDIYVANTFPPLEPLVDRFTEAREYIAPSLIRTSESEGGGIAVDQSNGEIYLADNTPTSATVSIYGNVAVLLPTVTTSASVNIFATTATVHGAVNPEGVEVTDCHFAYVEEAAYNPSVFDPYAAGKTVPCAETVGSSSSEVAVHADVTGLQTGTTYHYRVVASNEHGTNTGSDETFSTPPPPTITGAAAHGLTATAVDLSAQIDPHGTSTHYHLEYGTTISYGTVIPQPDAPVGSEPEEINQHITGLTADMIYHWRVVATNEAGTTTTPDHTFNYATGSASLPDNRAYEMVTPPSKNGALIGDVFLGLLPDLSRDGERLILSSIQCFGDAESCIVNRAKAGASFEFARTPGGWHASSLSPSAQQFQTNAVWSVSADSGRALYSMPTPPNNQDDLYVRTPGGEFRDIGPVTPPENGAKGAIGAQSAASKAATADFSRYVYGLSEPVWPFDASLGNRLYEYVGSGNAQPLLVGVTGGRGSHDLVSVCGTELGTGVPEPTYPGALSGDGGTVFFTATGRADGSCAGSGANAGVSVLANTLYARVHESETVLISGHSTANCDSSCQTSVPGDAEFQGASTDGSRVFFTSTQRLTDVASEDEADTAGGLTGCSVAAGVGGCNLYEYDFSRPVDARLVAVSAGDSSGNGPRVQGVMAVSDDGSRVYFVAKGVLSGTKNARGQLPVNGGDNLYVYDEGRTRFIATLITADEGEWSQGALYANVSPDGRFLVFGSGGRLTEDTGTTGVFQVFRYDASTDELVRLSHGEAEFNDRGNSPANAVCFQFAFVSCPEGAWIVHPITGFSFAGSWRRDPSMSDDGSFVFFMSPVGLTPGAVNDVQIGEESGLPVFAENVYEWHDGRVSLISDGRDVSVAPTALCGLRSAVCLAGASVSGRDVFFNTTDRLVAGDTDTQLDFYDARICSSGDPCVSEPGGSVAACGGEACHGIPSGTPPPPAAPSASFSGAENPTLPKSAPAKRCRKHFVKRHGKCVRVKVKSRKHGRGHKGSRAAGIWQRRIGRVR
jgi:hypothetical protein